MHGSIVRFTYLGNAQERIVGVGDWQLVHVTEMSRVCWNKLRSEHHSLRDAIRVGPTGARALSTLNFSAERLRLVEVITQQKIIRGATVLIRETAHMEALFDSHSWVSNERAGLVCHTIWFATCAD